MNFNGTLENGVELYTCLNPGLRGFCLSLWVRRGSMHEEIHGLVHMLEHVSFRVLSHRLGGGLYRELARLGLSFDASTYTGYVRFEMSGPPESFEAGVRLLMMVLDPPELPLEALNLERRRVQAEIREADAAESANARVWKGTPLARSITGTVHSTNLIGFDQLRQEHARWFSRGNFFFCVTGNAPGMDGFIRRLAALTPPVGEPPVECAPVPEGFLHRDAEVFTEDSRYPALRFCFDVEAARHSETAHMLLMDYLLGDLGRLYLALSEDRALIYNLDDCFERFANIGCLSFEFEVEQARMADALRAVVEALNATKAMPDDDFAAWQRCFLADSDIERDYICTFNNSWGYDNGLRHAGFQSPEEQRAAYAAVTPEEVRTLAGEIFTPDHLVLRASGNPRRIDIEALRVIAMEMQ